MVFEDQLSPEFVEDMNESTFPPILLSQVAEEVVRLPDDKRQDDDYRTEFICKVLTDLGVTGEALMHLAFLIDVRLELLTELVLDGHLSEWTTPSGDDERAVRIDVGLHYAAAKEPMVLLENGEVVFDKDSFRKLAAATIATMARTMPPSKRAGVDSAFERPAQQRNRTPARGKASRKRR